MYSLSNDLPLVQVDYSCLFSIIMLGRNRCRGLARYGHHKVATALKKVKSPNQNMWTPPSQTNQIVSVIPFKWCESFAMGVFILYGKQGFYAFFGGSKTALSKLTQEFLPQTLWSWLNSRVF